MKRFLLGVLLLLLSVGMLFFVNPAFAYTVDGSVTDWGINLNEAVNKFYLDNNKPAGPTVNIVTEDNADINTSGQVLVGPGWTGGGNLYDAEALYFDNDATRGYIALITGTPWNALYQPGDIGINISTLNNAALFDNSPTVKNMGTVPYEYAIKMNFGTGTPNAELVSVTDWWSVYYDGTPGPNYGISNPFTVKSVTKIGDVNFAYTTTPLSGHYVYEMSFLLADLGLNSVNNLDIHWTMRCGNDFLNLQADVHHAPEPTTILLFGLGLLGLTGVSRKHK